MTLRERVPYPALALILCGLGGVLVLPARLEASLPDRQTITVEETPARASVNGKYRLLLRELRLPQDINNYQEFCDYGFWNGNAYAGFQNLPPGYWVYVYPNWYIWGECTQP